MADSVEFDSIAVVKMLKAFHNSLASESDKSGDANFVGTILERNLKEKFDRDRPASGFIAANERAGESRDFEVTFLMVKEANRALKAHRPDLAMEFVDRALSVWGGPKHR